MSEHEALLAIVALLCGVVLVWAGWKRFPLRIGLGNFFRRKTQVAIVVAGLLIGTAIISSSNVIQSTFDYTIHAEVFRVTDHVDEILIAPTANVRQGPFDEAVFDALRANLSSMPHVDGLAPRYELQVSVVDDATDLFEPAATLAGFDVAYDLGRFVLLDGQAWDGAGLGTDEAIINAKLAGAVEASAGDPLVVYLATPFGPRPWPLTVREVVRDEGRGAWLDDANLFVRLDALQAALGRPGVINAIHVSNIGGVREGYLVTDDAVRELEANLDASSGLIVDRLKADAIEQATENASQLSELFTLLGVFTIFAGVLLIINIFVMLAEERKGEMGVARAVGMRRTNLVQSFVAEGLLYAVVSAAIGALAGLLVAAAILWSFDLLFPAGALGGVRFVLSFTASDLLAAFAIGFLITMGTIMLASWRVSKLNIVRAIRDIPEPTQHRSTRPQLALGSALAIAGAIAFFLGVLDRNALLHAVGPCGLAIGLAVVFMRSTSPRIAFSAAGAFILVWLLNPIRPFLAETEPGISMFIAIGLLLVLGGLLIVMFNSDTLLAVFTKLIRRRRWLPVVRTAISYPMNKKFRTGVTLASIALIMFTIATMSGVQAMVESTIQTTTLRESGGFDLLAQTNPSIPKPNWTEEYEASNVSARIAEDRGLSLARVQVAEGSIVSPETHNTSLLGVPSDWVGAVPFEFDSLDPAYADPQAAWAAIEADPGLAILDGTVLLQNFGPQFGTFSAAVGDVFAYRNATGAVREIRVIGILYERFVPGFFVGWDTVRADFGVDYPSVFYFKVAPGEDAADVGHELERTFVQYQMLTFDFAAFIDQILEVTMGVFNLLQAYLALGLIVGIAGLGVVTMRNVIERRTETGALRAIGFRRSMVLRSFLFELSFVALTGIAMGVVLGMFLAYNLYLEFFADQGAFVIPWIRLVVLSAIAFLGAMLATASPAIRAARMPPAQALRSYE